jgi:hypothetical protein
LIGGKMNLHKVIVLTLFTLFIITSCSSSDIRYPETLSKRSIDISLYITAKTVPSYECSSSIMKCSDCDDNKARIYSGFNKVDMKNIVETEFNKQKADISEMINVREIIRNKLVYKTSSPDNNKEFPSIDFLENRRLIKNEYLLELNVIDWGFIYFTGRPCLKLKYYGALYEVRTGAVIWFYHDEQIIKYYDHEKINTVTEEITEVLIQSELSKIMHDIFSDIYSVKKSDK